MFMLHNGGGGGGEEGEGVVPFISVYLSVFKKSCIGYPGYTVTVSVGHKKISVRSKYACYFYILLPK